MVKKLKRKLSFKVFLQVLISIIFFVGMGILHVHQHFQIVNLGLEMGRKMREERGLLREKDYLRRELYSLKLLSRIENEALRLGLQYPHRRQIKIIEVTKDDL